MQPQPKQYIPEAGDYSDVCRCGGERVLMKAHWAELLCAYAYIFDMFCMQCGETNRIRHYGPKPRE